MSKKKLYLVLLFAFISLVLFWTGCESTVQENPTASLGLESSGSLQFSFNKASLAGEAGTVDTVTVILTRSGYEAITKNLAVGDVTASGTIYNIPEGVWELTVNAKDSSGAVLYNGAKQIEIAGDETTSVTIELSDTSTSGNLSILVTWEEGDGINWTKYDNNPVLDLGAAGQWDEVCVSYSSIIYDGTLYKMWYSGSDGVSNRIGYAISSDGISWTRYSGNPVIDIDDGNLSADQVTTPCVYYDGNIYKMWFGVTNGNTSQISYATSVDGINWDINVEPVIKVSESGEWDDYKAICPSVIFNGISYEMWYVGSDSINFKIGYASSPDGIHWNKYSGNPVLEQGESGEWDQGKYLTSPCVVYNGIDYEMWYGGNNTGLRMGYATSSDGINWTKYSGNPVVTKGAIESWDGTSVYGPSVIFDGSIYKMWFIGQNGQTTRIGYATSP